MGDQLWETVLSVLERQTAPHCKEPRDSFIHAPCGKLDAFKGVRKAGGIQALLLSLLWPGGLVCKKRKGIPK